MSRDAPARRLGDTYGMRLLVTGATGYIGGRLIPQLLGRGHEVRVLARHPERLSERSWADRVEVFAGDATDPDALRAAMTGMDGAYYLMHSLTAGHGFEEQERATLNILGQESGILRRVPAHPTLRDQPHEPGTCGPNGCLLFFFSFFIFFYFPLSFFFFFLNVSFSSRMPFP